MDTVILVAYDGSPGGRAALAWALAEGARRRRPLKLVYVVDPDSPLPPVRSQWPHRDSRIEAEVRLSRVAVEANAWGRAGMDLTTAVREGSPAGVLREWSDGVGLIVVGDHGHGGAGPRLGSVAVGLAADARCSVVVVRGPLRVPDRRPVIVGVDGPNHRDVVAAALEEATVRGVDLVALRSAGTATDAEGDQALVRDAIESGRARFPGVAVIESIVAAPAATALGLASQGAQLVVVGARGSGGAAGRPLGSTGESILHHGQSSVMIVR